MEALDGAHKTKDKSANTNPNSESGLGCQKREAKATQTFFALNIYSFSL